MGGEGDQFNSNAAPYQPSENSQRGRGRGGFDNDGPPRPFINNNFFGGGSEDGGYQPRNNYDRGGYRGRGRGNDFGGGGGF